MRQDAVTAELGHRPGKVIALHLNYPSRCAQRGRTPKHASYFLNRRPRSPAPAPSGARKAPSCSRSRARSPSSSAPLPETSPPRTAGRTSGGSRAANDLGLQDLRYADKGSNVRSKGGDGYTALGPRLLDARAVDPAGLRIRTWLDGDLVQDDTTDTLLFDFGQVVADLSRFMTLEVGDVVLTGTPAGA